MTAMDAERRIVKTRRVVIGVFGMAAMRSVLRDWTNTSRHYQ